MYKFCHYLTKPIITRIIVSLMFKNVIIRIEVTVFRDFITFGTVDFFVFKPCAYVHLASQNQV